MLRLVDEMWASESAVPLLLGWPEAEPPPAPAPVPVARAKSKDRLPTQDVQQFLNSIGCGDRLDALAEFGVHSMDDLPFLEPDDFVELQFSRAQQRAICDALKPQVDGPMSPPVAPATLGAGAPPPPMALQPEAEPEPAGQSPLYISPFLNEAATDEEAERVRSRYSATAVGASVQRLAAPPPAVGEAGR